MQSSSIPTSHRSNRAYLIIDSIIYQLDVSLSLGEQVQFGGQSLMHIQL